MSIFRLSWLCSSVSRIKKGYTIYYYITLHYTYLIDKLFFKKEPFSPASGVIGLPRPYTSKYLPKTWRGFIFGPYAHFFIMNLFFRFFLNPQGPPLDFQKIEQKKIKFFEKKIQIF